MTFFSKVHWITITQHPHIYEILASNLFFEVYFFQNFYQSPPYLQDNHEDISDLNSHIHKMGHNGKQGGNPELYAAAWFYGVNVTIFSQEYTNNNGMLVINADEHQETIDTARVMWTISFHGNC